MSISFSCENCGKTFQADAIHAGKKGKCKQCGHTFIIPKPAPAAARPRSQIKTKPAGASPSRQSDLDGLDDPYGLDEVAPLPPRQAVPSRGDEGEKVRGPLPLKAKKPQRSTGPDPGIFGGLPLAFYLFAFAVAAACFAVANLGPSTPGLALLGVTDLVGLFALLYGAAGMILVPNREGTIHGILALLFWPYQLFYLVTRWPAVRGAFLSELAGAAILAVAVASMFQMRPGPASVRGGGRQPHARVGADDDLITLEVTGLTGPDSGAYFLEKLGNIKNTGLASTYGNGKGVFQIRPNMTAEELARRIDFAKVTSVSGRTLYVVAGPAPARPSRPTDLDPITQTLYDLQAPGTNAKQTALQKLAKLPIVDDRRDEVASAVETVIRQSKSSWVRNDALRALAVWGRKESTPVLLELLEEDDSGVVRQTLITLISLRDPAAAKPVAALLVGTEHRHEASEVLKAIGNEAAPAVGKYVDHKDSEVRRAAIEILDKIGPPSEASPPRTVPDPSSPFRRKERRDPALGAEPAGS